MNYWRLMLTKHVNNGKSLPEVIDRTKTLVYDKIQGINNWYVRTTGLDKVQECQELVTSLQRKLLEVQENRRNTGYKLNDMRKKSNELQEQIRNLKRHEEPERFINLMKEDTLILKVETDLQKLFTELDRQERDIFTGFTNAVRDSHEKQRWQLEYTKYLGYGLSIVGSLLAFVYATFFRENLKRSFDKRLNLVVTHLDNINKQLNDLNQRNGDQQDVVLTKLPDLKNEVPIINIDTIMIRKYVLYGCLAYIGLRILFCLSSN